jgi:phytoene dehydrogenase-like protein
MAGLVAAARARELGAGVVVHEKGDRPGGSMYLSSCVVWRYREFERFREECP